MLGLKMKNFHVAGYAIENFRCNMCIERNRHWKWGGGWRLALQSLLNGNGEWGGVTMTNATIIKMHLGKYVLRLLSNV